MKHWLHTAVVLGWLAGAKVALPALPGALESFPNLDHAEAWTVLNLADNGTYYPKWWNDDNPYLFYFHQGDAALWIFSDLSGSGDLMGDYEVDDIQSITVDVWIDSLEDFDQLDCALLTNGPAGWQYYYSDSFWDSDFSEAGWWTLTFNLAATWHYVDNNEWITVEMQPEHFKEVEEIGFRFFPREGTTAEIFAGIDEVSLDPLVKAPVLKTATTTTDFLLKFTPLKANTNFIEQLSETHPLTWEEVPGQTDISGSQGHLFSTSLNAGRGIFRVGAEARYTQITIDGSLQFPLAKRILPPF